VQNEHWRAVQCFTFRLDQVVEWDWDFPFLRPIGYVFQEASRRESEQEHWQTAMACRLSADEKSGLVMMARIVIVRGLQSGKPGTAPEPGKKPAEKYRIVN
jgi:hypothetical protein